MRILYKPRGAAGEYAGDGYALNHLTGCSHECRYCYVPDVLRMKRDEFHGSVAPKKDVLKRLAMDMADLGIMQHPIFMSFVCDPLPYGWDDIHALTWLAMQSIHKSGNLVRLLTKNPAAVLRHPEVLGGGDELGTTLVFSKQLAGKHWEPNAPASMERLNALEKIKALRPDVKIWISFEPIVDPEQTLLMARRAAEVVDYMWFGPLNHAHRMAPGYASLVGEVDWPGFVARLGAVMAEKGFGDWRLKEALRAVVGLRREGLV